MGWWPRPDRRSVIGTGAGGPSDRAAIDLERQRWIVANRLNQQHHCKIVIDTKGFHVHPDDIHIRFSRSQWGEPGNQPGGLARHTRRPQEAIYDGPPEWGRVFNAHLQDIQPAPAHAGSGDFIGVGIPWLFDRRD